jgi:hypothetical protein
VPVTRLTEIQILHHAPSRPAWGFFVYHDDRRAELTPGSKTGKKMAGVAITHDLKSPPPAKTPSSHWARQT